MTEQGNGIVARLAFWGIPLAVGVIGDQVVPAIAKVKSC